MAPSSDKPRQRRANGEASRRRILDAATEIATERGYDGTSIGLISERSGLPASSIYWHFTDKDTLLAAVIEHSFEGWLNSLNGWSPASDDLAVPARIRTALDRTATSLRDHSDFLRLGLMLALERRPEEPSARRMFLRVREEALRRTVGSFGHVFPELDERAIRQLATFVMAMADGIFVAMEIDGDELDLLLQIDMLAAAVVAAAEHLVTSNLDGRAVRTAS